MGEIAPDQESSVTTYKGVFRFSHKTWWDHTKGVLSHPRELILVILAVFCTLWTIGDASRQLLELHPRGLYSYLFLCGLSVILGVGREIYRYINVPPEGLESVSKRAQRIAHLQRPKWEFALAKTLLAERLGPIDRECADLLAGKFYVYATKPADITEYIRWLESRNDNLYRMLGIAKLLIVQEFPTALKSTSEKPAVPEKILSTVEALERFYHATVEFERSSHAVIPPEGFERIHALQIGWTTPIREAVLQLFRFLQQVTELNADADSSLKFEIEFGSLPNVDEFCEEMERLQQLLPTLD